MIKVVFILHNITENITKRVQKRERKIIIINEKRCRNCVPKRTQGENQLYNTGISVLQCMQGQYVYFMTALDVALTFAKFWYLYSSLAGMLLLFPLA